MKVISVAELQSMTPYLAQRVGEEYLILNEKTKQIVGMVKVIEPPETYTKMTNYEVVYKKKKNKEVK
jgi:hypothetical protein